MNIPLVLAHPDPRSFNLPVVTSTKAQRKEWLEEVRRTVTDMFGPV